MPEIRDTFQLNQLLVDRPDRAASLFGVTRNQITSPDFSDAEMELGKHIKAHRELTYHQNNVMELLGHHPHHLPGDIGAQVMENLFPEPNNAPDPLEKTPLTQKISAMRIEDLAFAYKVLPVLLERRGHDNSLAGKQERNEILAAQALVYMHRMDRLEQEFHFSKPVPVVTGNKLSALRS